ncbi:hypothetical protein EDD15DRAFT_2514726, partial [Pisolithus albus]
MAPQPVGIAYALSVEPFAVNLPFTDCIREFPVGFPTDNASSWTPRESMILIDQIGYTATIAKWLEKKYREAVKPTGIIYTHRITDNRMSGRLHGDRAAERHESRVSQLETNFLKPLIDRGARHREFKDNSSKSAWEIVQDVVGDGEALLLREELVDAEGASERDNCQKSPLR